MTILAIGASFKTAATELLERLSVPDGELNAAVDRLRGSPAIGEVVVLSTCNRTEVYVAPRGSVHQASHAVDHFFAARAGLSVAEVCGFLRVRRGGEAVTHLCAVACGLDSMATGEEHIVAQVRGALRAARTAGAVGPVLGDAFDTAFRTSRRARTETGIGRTAPSLLSAGLELAGTALGGLAGKRAVLVGSGTIGTLAARGLRDEGVAEIRVASRTRANAERLAREVGGSVVAPGTLVEALARADVLVCSTGAPEQVVTAGELRAARRGNGHRPMFGLDLAMPRDIDPACRDVDGVTLVDLDVLGGFLAGRGELSEVDAAWRIVAEEAAALAVRDRAVSATPLIAALRSRAAELVGAELTRLRSRLPALDDHEQAETESALHRVVQKLLHRPTVRIRELSAAADGELYVDALYRVFGVPREADRDVNRENEDEVSRT
ncbi:glutamyl-tRNA reductase [Actinophytocola gossypii]|uniref:Glutamyl-tRNA reductase n=1 Tax=Actinophytocola gossypii TaxID=2812003 RepID=A0ABT2JH04_9PSEU|nr:glutamyl-tRNA reductase [Actinophytocola gossypii]MCT2587166.1 glutamyl-tRNA reductase [Actinophytocola gossypii]